MNAGARPRTLEGWVNAITREDMPIFGHTVQSVVSVAEDEEAPATELAKVVLQDASMTARTLKLANTPFYNPRDQAISTVSRAIVVLGFDAVRSMCLSISLVDAFVRGDARDRLTIELARSIHAAVQARTIAMALDDAEPEEVFIATLLYHLGDLAFWCFAGELGEQLNELERQPGYEPEDAQRELLGFRLNELTRALAREWRINGLLLDTLRDPESGGIRGRTIRLSHRLARAAEKGWNSPEMKAVIAELADITKQPVKEMRESVHRNAREAARVAALYGAATAARVIPLPGAGGEPELEAVEVEAFPEADPMLQLRILRELGMLLEEGKADFNLVMEMVLEGIFRGVGTDRTLFALLTPDRNQLAAKYLLGNDDTDLRGRFRFQRDGGQNLLFEAMERKLALWGDIKRRPELARLLPQAVTKVIGRAPFLLSPIVVSGRAVGLFYADRALSGRELDEETFESFKHFGQQANLALSHLAGGGK